MDVAQPHPITRDLELVAVRAALEHLRALHQQLNPSKLVVYSECAGAEPLPVA